MATAKSISLLEPSGSLEVPEAYVLNSDLQFATKEINPKLRFKIDIKKYIAADKFPQSIKVVAYKYTNNVKDILSTVYPTITSPKQAKDFFVKVEFENLNSSSDIYLDLYDVNNKLFASYKTYIDFEESLTQEQAELANASCSETGFGACQLEYLLQKIKFQATPTGIMSTNVNKQNDGTYIVKIPMLHRHQKIKKTKVKDPNSNNDDSETNSIIDNEFISFSENGLNFLKEGLKKAYLKWDENLDALVINLENDQGNLLTLDAEGHLGLGARANGSYLQLKAGDATNAPLKFLAGDLTTSLIDGALEFDGSKLYFTANGTRSELGAQGPQGEPGSSGPTGPQGPAGPAGSFNGGGASINGALTFLSSGLLEDAVLNGTSLFTDSSTAQFNGEVIFANQSSAPAAAEGFGKIFVNGNILYFIDNGGTQTDLLTGGAGDLLAANNLSDVASAATARTNLGLAIGTDVQAYNANLTTWAGKTAPSGTVVGTTDTQTLTNKTLTSPSINSGLVNGSTINGATINSANLVTPSLNGAVSFANANSWLEDPLLNGTALFRNASTAQFNGEVMFANQSSAPAAAEGFGKIFVNGNILYFIDNGGTQTDLLAGGGGGGDATTLDTIDSLQFLRSDTSDSYTSGTLTFDAGTTVDLNTTTLQIADTDITLDGASTTFTQTTGAITLAPASGSNLNISLAGAGDLAISTDDFYIDTSTHNIGISTSSPTAMLDINGHALFGATGSATFNETGAAVNFRVESDSDANALTVNGTSNNVGIGTLTATKKLTVSGGVYATGLQLVDGNEGASKVLTSDGSGNASWQANSGGDATTLDTIDSLQFLRSDTSDSYTSGTLTFDAGTTVDLNTTTLQIADTDITLDGASTTFTQTTGAITLTPAAGSNLNVDLSGAGDFSVNGTDLYLDTSAAKVGIGTGTPSTKLDINGSTMSKTFFNKALNTVTSAATITVDWNDGNKQVVTLSQAGHTVNFTNPTTGIGSFVLIVKQDATGSRTVTTWDSDIKWPSGTIPTLTTTASGIDVITCLYDGTNYYCQIGLDFN